jgi:hypothetical protein
MGIEVTVDCNCTDCGSNLDDGDYSYCEGCMQELKDKIEELEAELEECKEGCSECNNKVKCLTTKTKK